MWSASSTSTTRFSGLSENLTNIFKNNHAIYPAGGTKMNIRIYHSVHESHPAPPAERTKINLHQTANVAFAVVLLTLSGILPLLSARTEAEILPDYDLEVSKTVVNISPLTDVGSFNAVITNQCMHTLTIHLSVSSEGSLSCSPAESDFTLAPGVDTTTTIGIFAPYSTPAGVYEVAIRANITQVDGAPVQSGKVRHASLIAVIPEIHSVNAKPLTLSAEPGKALTARIALNNSGNAPEWASLRFCNTTGVMGYAGVGYIRVPAGGSADYPVLITVPEGAEGSKKLEFDIVSLSNEERLSRGDIIVDIQGKKSNSAGGPLLSGPAMLTATAFILIVGLILVQWTRKTGWKRAERGLSGEGRPLPHLPLVGILVALLILLSSAQGAGAQFDKRVSVSPPNGEINPSPLSEGGNTVTIEVTVYNDNTSVEQVIEASVNAPGLVTGYVKEHRVPSQGSTTFPVSFGVNKEAAHSLVEAKISIKTIERDGIPTGSIEGQPVNAGAMIQITPYSLPEAVPDSFAVKRADAGNLSLTIQNSGNAQDDICITVGNAGELESRGVHFSNTSISAGPIDAGGSAHLNMAFTDTGKDRDFTVIHLTTNGSLVPDTAGECTVVMAKDVKHTGGSDSPFIPAPLIILALLAALVVRRRRR